MKRLASLWQYHPIIVSAFFLAVILTIFFLFRSVTLTVYWADPERRDLRLESWMTTGYVARSWRLPREVMVDALGLPPLGGKSITMGQIADERGLTLDQLSAQIETAAAVHRSQTEAAEE